jgi:hypothetical protein
LVDWFGKTGCLVIENIPGIVWQGVFSAAVKWSWSLWFFGWLKLCIQNVVMLSKKDRPAFPSLLSPCLAGVFYGFSARTCFPAYIKNA